MPKFVLQHRHQARECRTAYAAWSGFSSPLREQPTLACCASGGHRIFWVVTAADKHSALAQLPDWLAARTEETEVQDVAIP
jgi:hypothetical protein